MNYVYFVKSGWDIVSSPERKLFLFSEQRQSHYQTLFHRNNFTTFIRFPYSFFKKNFKYEHLSGIYRTELKNKDIWDYCCIFDHEKQKEYKISDFYEDMEEK